ncbi:MAG: hypothetical protein II467_06835, partial [Bacilli bacterium]|nr:hypothetical protein [Bacilli bacterium]
IVTILWQSDRRFIYEYWHQQIFYKNGVHSALFAVHRGVLLANRYLITNEVIAVTASLKTHAIIKWQGID